MEKWILTLISILMIMSGCSPIYYSSSPPAAPMPMQVGAPSGLTPPPPPPGEEGLVAYLHSWPFAKGPRVVEIRNYSHYFLRVRVDGQEIRWRDRDVWIPHLPPEQYAYFFTYKFGEVHVEAIAFLPPDFQKVAFFQSKVYFSPNWESQRIEFETHWFTPFR